MTTLAPILVQDTWVQILDKEGFAISGNSLQVAYDDAVPTVTGFIVPAFTQLDCLDDSILWCRSLGGDAHIVPTTKI